MYKKFIIEQILFHARQDLGTDEFKVEITGKDEYLGILYKLESTCFEDVSVIGSLDIYGNTEYLKDDHYETIRCFYNR